MILFRYIALGVLLPTVASTVLLLLIFAAWSATEILADAVAGRVAADAVAMLVAVRCLIAADVILPTAFFGATVWMLVRLDRDSELVIIRSAGVDGLRLYLLIGTLGMLVGSGVVALSMEGRPWGYRMAQEMESEILPGDLGMLAPGRFYTFADSMTLFPAGVDRSRSTMQDVFAERQLANGVEVIRARELRLATTSGADSRRMLEFEDGHSWLVVKRTLGDRVHGFDRLVYRLAPTGQAVVNFGRRGLPTDQLLAFGSSRHVSEWQWRMVTGPLTVMMALLAVQIGRGRPREGVYGRLVVALVAWVVVFNLAAMARTWVENGDVAAWPGLWWVLAVPPALQLGLRLMRRRL